jgi:plastocyanin domain-containing protein
VNLPVEAVMIVVRTLLVALLGLATLPGGQAFAAPPPAPQQIVVEGSYQPDRVVVKEGERVVLRFLRKDYGGCTLEVVFPTLGQRHKLPTNQPVEVDLGTPAAGEIPFHCGMNMIRGVVVVEPRS